MRILVVTNFYPPHELGGQGRSCQRAVEGLRRRGHTVAVLTSMHGTKNRKQEGEGIYRWLYLEMDFTPWRNSLTFFTARHAREAHNLERLEHLFVHFTPDVVFMWGMWNLPRSLPARAEALAGTRVLYRFAEYWPTLPSQHEQYWREPARRWWSQLPKRVMRPLALRQLAREPRPALAFKHAICVSAAVRDELVAAGIPVQGAPIVHTGIDVMPFRPVAREPRAVDPGEPVRLLYAGRLAETKGVDITIKALARLKQMPDLPPLPLSIAGAGTPRYERELRALVASLNLENDVTFLGRVPTGEMPALLQRHELLLVPSTWPEPFARIVLEGMAAGVVVVASRVGGMPEMVRDGENGMLCEPGDEEDLARHIAALATDPARRERLGRAGQATVLTHFTEDEWLVRLEKSLEAVVSGSEGPSGLAFSPAGQRYENSTAR